MLKRHALNSMGSMTPTDSDAGWVHSSDVAPLENKLEESHKRESHHHSHIEEAMKLMRDSGADEREYVVYAVLAAGLSPEYLLSIFHTYP